MMDEKMVKEIKKNLADLGVKKDMIDEYMVWGAMKTMLGTAKMKWALTENGMSKTDADKMVEKITSKMAKMNLKIDCAKDHHHHGGCCQ